VKLLRPGQCREELRQAVRARFLKGLGMGPSGDSAGRDEPIYGCQLWADYLLHLERLREFGDLEITAEEAEGLMLVQNEREAVRREYVPCPRCGAWTARAMAICPRGHKLE